MDQGTRVAKRSMAHVRLRVALFEALGASITGLLVVAFGVFRLNFWHLRHPVLFSGDVGIMLEYIKNGLQNGGVDIDPQLGWPFHPGLAAFPVLDNLSAGAVKFISFLTKDPAVGNNLLIYVGHVVSGIVGYLCFRALRIPRVSAVACGVAFAWVEFALEPGRVVAHVSLQLIAPLAIGSTLALLPAARPTAVTLRWVWFVSLGAAAVAGLGQPYWIAFASLAVASSVAGHLVAGRYRGALLLASAAGTMLAVAALCLVWPRLVGQPAIPIDRSPYQQPILGLHFINLLIPPRSNVLPGIDRFYASFVENSGAVSEGFDAFLGWAGVLGFVLGLILLLRAPLRRRTSAAFTASELAAMLLIMAALFSQSYGLGELFNLLVTPEIRAQNRITPLIAFFALFVFADITGRLRLPGTRHRVVGSVLVAAIIAFSLWDVSSGIDYHDLQLSPTTVQRWDVAKHDADVVKDVLPIGSKLFQMPEMFFPENPPIGGLGTYQQMHLALFTKNYYYSFGAVQGAPSYIDQSSPAAEAISAAAIGYDELLLYKAGYPGGIGDPIAAMQDKLPIEGNMDTETFIGLDLRPLHDGVAPLHPDVLRLGIDWARHGFSTLEQDGATPVRWDDSADGTGVVAFDNPSSTPVPMQFCSTIVPAMPGSYPGSVDAAGQVTPLLVGPGGVKVNIAFNVPPGRSTLSISVPAPRLPTPTDIRHIHFQLRDTVLEPAAIRIRAQDIADRAGVSIADRCH